MSTFSCFYILGVYSNELWDMAQLSAEGSKVAKLSTHKAACFACRAWLSIFICLFVLTMLTIHSANQSSKTAEIWNYINEGVGLNPICSTPLGGNGETTNVHLRLTEHFDCHHHPLALNAETMEQKERRKQIVNVNSSMCCSGYHCRLTVRRFAGSFLCGICTFSPGTLFFCLFIWGVFFAWEAIWLL